jgi:ATP-dependent helicase/nuclease subunit A
MNPSLQACQPETNASVSASAGSGKTWLLVSRIIRLLLAGAKPDTILAITFTRKAAIEMSERLMSRLYEFAVADEAAVIDMLTDIGMHAEQADVELARSLYESLLGSNQAVTITTFHAFSQQILRRFPLEADIAANFELLETTELFRQEAWDAMMEAATQQPSSQQALSLEYIMSVCQGIYNARTALYSFLEHRSDWWAMSEPLEQPVEEVCDALASQLDIDPDNPPDSHYLLDQHAPVLQEFVELLRKHPTKTNTTHADNIETALATPEKAFMLIRQAFLTKDGNPLKTRKPSKTQATKMGVDGELRFLDIHNSMSAAILELQDLLARHQSWHLNRHWLIAGQGFLHQYQRIKTNRRMLDFADLEWKACQLLNTADNAHWIQYKLDQRISHLLVDEFQDTNPTQWRLLKPLLDELASSEQARTRSCFIVGDSKQSIYGFRRADSSLFTEASNWLNDNLAATTVPLETSWRSSPVIIDFVNKLFSAGELAEQIKTFSPHKTHKQELWGRVEVLPLFDEPETNEAEQQTELRNPLITPRRQHFQQRYQQEADAIASRIQEMLNSGLQIDDAGKQRAIRYSDIMILLRARTAAASYEAALKKASIPYFGADKCSLLERIEIGDMMALLDVLVAPHNNLALARVLRSPLFSFSDEQLVTIAEVSRKHACDWMKALDGLASETKTDDKYIQASSMLSAWHSLCGTLPVHDLLDKIYSEANVFSRFAAAAPAHLRMGVKANLTRFIELALEIDSGRYPSMSQFRAHLRAMSEFAPDGLNSAHAIGDSNRVHIMTIHASKGLEAPVVFLADSARPADKRDAYKALVAWSASQARPDTLMLLPPQKQRDNKLLALQERQALRDRHEQANLLYVALTRAKQMLIVSACKPQKGDSLGWYGQICQQLQSLTGSDCQAQGYVNASTTEPCNNNGPQLEEHTAVATNISQLLPPAHAGRPGEIAPSYQRRHLLSQSETQTSAYLDEVDTILARQRGVLIHNMLERMANLINDGQQPLLENSKLHYQNEFSESQLIECWDEGIAAIEQCPQSDWFDANIDSLNEVPLIYTDKQSGRTVHGIIDRLVIKDDCIIIIDYKTHRATNISEIAAQYREQMRYYVEGIRLLWPGKQVTSWLYFTHSRQALEIYS